MKQLEKLSKVELYEALEEITFNNIVHWRKPELLRILGGERAIHVIPQSNQRHKLNRDGILEIGFKRGGKTVSVSARAIRILEEES